MRQFYEAGAFDQKFLWSVASLRLLADLTTVATHSAFSCDLKKFLHLLQLRSEPDVRIHFVDDGKRPFLNEFGESWGVVASEKALVFFDNHNTQRGEAQLTYKNRGL